MRPWGNRLSMLSSSGTGWESRGGRSLGLGRRWEGYVGKVREALGAPGTSESGYKLQDGIVGVLDMASCQPREVSIRGHY